MNFVLCFVFSVFVLCFFFIKNFGHLYNYIFQVLKRAIGEESGGEGGWAMTAKLCGGGGGGVKATIGRLALIEQLFFT